MKYKRYLSQEQIIQKTLEDKFVGVALEDLVRSMSARGRYGVTGIRLLDVLADRLMVWAEIEQEPEGLDEQWEHG